MLKADFENLYKDGCIQTGADDPEISLREAETKFAKMFVLLMKATNNNPCADCPVNMKKCHAYRQHHSDAKAARRKEATRRKEAKNAIQAPGTEKYPGQSVAQIAAQLKISKKEVRRRKVKGQL